MDIFKPLTLFCDVGQTQATLMAREDFDLTDNVVCYATQPCSGCTRWSTKTVHETETAVRLHTLKQFGSDSDNLTGITDGRINQLNQLLVDRARFKGGEHQLVVAICTPVNSE